MGRVVAVLGQQCRLASGGAGLKSEAEYSVVWVREEILNAAISLLWSYLRPVDDKAVDVVDAQVLQGGAQISLHVLGAGEKKGGDQQLL